MTEAPPEHLVTEHRTEGGHELVGAVDQDAVCPSTTASSWPPIRVTTAGVPHAPASVTVIPHPSRSDEEATTHALR